MFRVVFRPLQKNPWRDHGSVMQLAEEARGIRTLAHARTSQNSGDTPKIFAWKCIAAM